MAKSNGKKSDKEKDGFSAPGITDLPQRLSRALGQAFQGPGRILSSAAGDLLNAASDVTSKDREQSLATATETVARAAGSAVVESARVVEDVAGGFVSPSGKERPKFVFTGNRVYPMAPYYLEGTSIHAFFIPTDRAVLARYLDKVFKEPTFGEVTLEPACSFIVAFVADTEKLRTADENETRGGYIKDQDAALWAFALRTKPSPKLCFVPLYHFVEHSISLAAGREIFGFPKQEADVKPPPAIGGNKPPLQGDLLEIKPFVLEAAQQDKPLAKKTVLKIRVQQADEDEPAAAEGAQAAPESSHALSMFQELAKLCLDHALEKSLNIERHVDKILELLGIDLDNFTGRIPMLFLKQIPSAADSSTCAYQAVVETALVVDTLEAHGVEDKIPLDLELPHPDRTPKNGFPSHPFEELGIDFEKLEISHRVFWMKGNLRLTKGNVLWSWPR